MNQVERKNLHNDIEYDPIEHKYDDFSRIIETEKKEKKQMKNKKIFKHTKNKKKRKLIPNQPFHLTLRNRQNISKKY